MHNRALHESLAAFVEEAAWQLAEEISGGAEIPFELSESAPTRSRSTAPLYCYRPLTGAFIAERIGQLAKLPSHVAARSQLAGLVGLDAYLRSRGARSLPTDPRDRGDTALQVFLTAIWADATDFTLDPARFGAAYAELEASVYAECSLTQVLAPVEGLVIESESIELGGGLSLVRAGTLRDAPDELHIDSWATVACVRAESGPGEPPALEAAGRRLRRLQTALRLWDDAEPAIGPGAWARTDSGPWLHVPLATGLRRGGGGDCLLEPEEEDPLRAFCSLVDRRTPRSGELAWALRRFELGCERATALEALTDWLLAGRAILAAPGGSGYEHMPERLAAICAHPEDRHLHAERIQRTIALERAAVAGLVRAEPEVESLVGGLGRDVRAILRDVLCGHLDPDLRAVADDLLGGIPTPAAEIKGLSL
jgi:hypothetical protein